MKFKKRHAALTKDDLLLFAIEFFIASKIQCIMHPFIQLKVVLGNKVGRLKHLRIMPGGALEAETNATSSTTTTSTSAANSNNNKMFIGRKLDDHRGAFYLEYPMDKGAVADTGWDAMERLWEVSQSC